MGEESLLGRVLVIANPASQSGRGAEGAAFVGDTLASMPSACTHADLRLTTGPGNALQIARAATCYDTVVALGGDGVIHEVVNGLMKIGPARRPRLGIIPLGSGNDYARTLGMAVNDPAKALSQLFAARAQRVDLGLVNGVYFDETLSFGVDAAIALDTMERRRRSGAHGTRLFAASGVEVIRNQLVSWPYEARLVAADGSERTWRGSSLIFAVQVGPTYGGGFRICPQADAADGLLDLCYSEGSPSKATALGILARARVGRHTGSRYLRLCQVRSLTLSFGGEPPCQVDGERLTGSHFEVSCAPHALEVLTPSFQF